MIEQPFEIDDDRTILIYGVRWSLGVFQAIGLGPEGTVFQIGKRGENGSVFLTQIYDYVPQPKQ